MLSSLIELARESNSETRRELLGRLADLFLSEDRDVLAEQQLQMFAGVVARILRDIDEPGRASFSGRYANNSRMPKQVAMALASDAASVADPVLQQSPVLDEDDLLQIASAGQTAHRVSISRRPGVTERLSDTLISFEELDVMQSLLDSDDAAISPRGYERMADHADADNGIRGKICLRGDVPIALAKKLLPHLGEAEKLKILHLIEQDASKVSHIVRDALPMVSYERTSRAKPRLQIKHMATLVQDGRLPVDSFVDDLLATKSTLDVALGLAELTNMTERHVANAILSVASEPLALVAKSVGLNDETYLRIEERRRAAMRLPNSESFTLLLAYSKLDRDQALRAMRFVRVRASVAAAS